MCQSCIITCVWLLHQQTMKPELNPGVPASKFIQVHPLSPWMCCLLSHISSKPSITSVRKVSEMIHLMYCFIQVNYEGSVCYWDWGEGHDWYPQKSTNPVSRNGLVGLGRMASAFIMQNHTPRQRLFARWTIHQNIGWGPGCAKNSEPQGSKRGQHWEGLTAREKGGEISLLKSILKTILCWTGIDCPLLEVVLKGLAPPTQTINYKHKYRHIL